MFKKCWVAQLFLVRPMKPSPFEIVLSLAGSVFMILIVFHKPLGFSDDWQWPLLIAVAACWIPLVILQRRGRNARLAAGLPALEKPLTKRSILVVSAPDYCHVAVWSVVAAVHGRRTSDLNAPRRLSYRLCVGRPCLCFRLAILEQKGLTNR